MLGIVLDGLGLGDDGTIWGGEFLLADYRDYRRLARLKPVAMPGGAQAVREPWRNLYAHLIGALGAQALQERLSGLDLHAQLGRKPLALLDAMIGRKINSPLASSCGRLFDAVAAALGLCFERQAYEGEAAMRLEAAAQMARSAGCDDNAAYPFAISSAPGGLMEIDPAPMWNSLIGDGAAGVPTAHIALRFHRGLAEALVATATGQASADMPRFAAVALSGGCFQNRILLETAMDGLRAAGFTVLAHAEVPANDGGLALGQAAIGAARLLAADNDHQERARPCVSAFQAALSE